MLLNLDPSEVIGWHLTAWTLPEGRNAEFQLSWADRSSAPLPNDTSAKKIIFLNVESLTFDRVSFAEADSSKILDAVLTESGLSIVLGHGRINVRARQGIQVLLPR